MYEYEINFCQQSIQYRPLMMPRRLGPRATTFVPNIAAVPSTSVGYA